MTTIKHTNTIVYCDGVQVFAGRDTDGGDYVGAMIDTVGGEDRYLVTAVAPHMVRRFYAGELDLRTLFLEASTLVWYTALINDDFDQPFVLEPRRESLLEMDYLPEPGFYLRPTSADDLATDSLKARRKS